jgi:hypothetical protein
MQAGLAEHVFDDFHGRLKPRWRSKLVNMLPAEGLDKEKAITAAAKEKNVQVAKAKVKAG